MVSIDYTIVYVHLLMYVLLMIQLSIEQDFQMMICYFIYVINVYDNLYISF